jgi:hypothetical protein
LLCMQREGEGTASRIYDAAALLLELGRAAKAVAMAAEGVPEALLSNIAQYVTPDGTASVPRGPPLGPAHMGPTAQFDTGLFAIPVASWTGPLPGMAVPGGVFPDKPLVVSRGTHIVFLTSVTLWNCLLVRIIRVPYGMV